MPQRRTAKKDLRQSQRRRKENLMVKRQLKTTVKLYKKAVVTNDEPSSQKALSDVYKAFDKAATKNVIHPNKAARKKSRFSNLLKAKTSKSTK